MAEKPKTSSAAASKNATKKRKKGRRKKSLLKRILTALGLIVCIGIIIVSGLVIGSLIGYVEETELIDVENMRLNLTSFVYVEDSETGEMIEYEQLYDTENRIWVASSEIPEHLKNAFVAIKDEFVDIFNTFKKGNIYCYGPSLVAGGMVKVI